LAFLKNISTSSLTDPELISLYQESGDLKILAELYEPYLDQVFGVCLKYLKDPETAKDSVMAIFEELIPKLKKHEVANFRGWLHTLAKNHCLMQLRSAKHFKISEIDLDLMQSPEEMHQQEIPQKEEDLDQLAKCMETLAPDQKITVELFYLQNKCYKEITLITGLEWNQVRSHIQNGRRNLKICLEQFAIHNQ
jgi:RNA polymerase sigma factor (sigma-70 family)